MAIREADLWQLRKQLLQLKMEQQKYARYGVTAICVITAIFIAMVFLGFTTKPDWEVVVLIALVSGLVGLPLFDKVSFGKDGGAIDLNDPFELIDRLESSIKAGNGESVTALKEQIGAVSLQLEELKARSTAGAIVSATTRSGSGTFTLDDARALLPMATSSDDLQKGRFGGSSANARRKLSARVETSEFGRPWQKLIIHLISTDGNPIQGEYAYFFLHDTFQPNVYRVKIARDGKSASLETSSVGAFTVGVVADDGGTLLELDLAGNEVSAPRWWKES